MKLNTVFRLTHTQLLPIILVKSTMVQSTVTNNIDRDMYTIPLNFNNGLVPECAQLMLWSGIQWVKYYRSQYFEIQAHSKLVVLVVQQTYTVQELVFGEDYHDKK